MYKLLSLAAVFLSANAVFAQDDADTTSQDEADVWEIVEEQWNAEENGDREWPDRLLTDDFAGWPKNSPAPRGKLSVKMWDRFTEQEGALVAHELYPYRIIVRDDVAVAHYLFSSAFKTKDGDIVRNNGRYTDILVRTPNGWRFLAWHGGNDDD